VDGGGMVRMMKGVRWEAPLGAIRVAGHEVVRGRVKRAGYCERWALITGAGARAGGSEVEASAAVGEEEPRRSAGQRRAAQRHRRSGSLDWLAGLGREWRLEESGCGGDGGDGGEGAEHLLFWTRRVACRLLWLPWLQWGGTKASEGRR
jgi:hypothetical protein